MASEAAPYAKTGGLADVIGALPFALADQGDEVAVVMPLYASAAAKAASADRVRDRLPIWISSSSSYQVSIRLLTDRGVRFYFVDCPPLFDRPGLYGENGRDYPDNHVRFAVLCRAALSVARHLFRPDLFHCHDWQAGLIGPYVRFPFRTDPSVAGLPTVLTIHNLGYQGLFDSAVLPDIGLGREVLNPGQMEFWGMVNYLKGGIVNARAITTVSQAYAREIQTPEYGFGLDGVLRTRSADIAGILNGVDYGEWSPEIDPYIAARYSAEELTGKSFCRRDLLQSFGLSDGDNPDRPVIGIVSRFAAQKGFDLIEQTAWHFLQDDVALVVLGTGEPHYESLMRRIAENFPNKAAVRLEFNNELAHKVEAGSDIFLMPSHYEPCGLNQIYSLRYGTVPVVRATGGLDDTIDENTGFKFADYTAGGLLHALGTAVHTFRTDKARWATLMRNGMARDHSWAAAARQYRTLYRQVLAA